MVEVSLDKPAAFLQLHFSGNVVPEDTRQHLPEVERLVSELHPGFRLLTDLTGLVRMDLGCLPHIRKIMDLLNAKGIVLVVRVIPDPHKDIGFNILSLFHYRRGIRIVTCETLEEARQALA